jgi:hypothetical protein
MSDLRALIESGLIDKEDGTIFDINTKLLWQRSHSSKKFSWQEAIDYCKSLTFAGHNDWRLPTVEELLSIKNEKHCNPLLSYRKEKVTIDPIFRCFKEHYWTITRLPDNQIPKHHAWTVPFFGVGYISSKIEDAHFVRAVRNV